jgi:hypothetical protein
MHYYNWVPYFTLWFTSVSIAKYVMVCICHCTIIQNSPTALKVLFHIFSLILFSIFIYFTWFATFNFSTFFFNPFLVCLAKLVIIPYYYLVNLQIIPYFFIIYFWVLIFKTLLLLFDQKKIISIIFMACTLCACQVLIMYIIYGL